ncbi:cell wall integrity and stress response component 4 [Sinocyclocheilus anshuiensis]|uniref:cell wall integrity and stress response component 4 n=1 Tax=Sinocyclocheilus anshuiensis TaxID=1608454 RepID=UPI0007B8471B|nr:PREDICTED: cell wall integrity and stress response component 4-like [Sinocyclocheilus anshuiensis]
MLTQPAGRDHTLKDYSSSKMMKIIPRFSTTLVVGWIVLFMGVNSVNISAVDSSAESTDASTPHSLTSVIMDLRITNRVYNHSLADQQSAEYTTLKQEVEQLFADIYERSYDTTHLIYLGTDEMIFSNGSVIVTSRLLFGPTQVNPELVRGIFFPAYKQIPSPALEIELSHIENELPTEEPLEEEKIFSRPPTTTHKEITFTTMPLTSTPDNIMDTESFTSRLPSTRSPNMSTSHPSGSSAVVGNITNSIHSTTSIPFNTTTMHLNTTTSSLMDNTKVPNGTTTAAPIGTIPTASNGTTTTDTITSVPNSTTTTTTPNNTTTTTAPNNTTTAVPLSTFTSIHSTVGKPTISSTKFTTAQPSRTTTMNHSPTTKVTVLVPGWAVALLALAAVSLFLLIILIILVVIWCCCPKRRVFMNEAEERNPPMFFNPDIPMYSTQSTFDTSNGKQANVREKPPKNRTGMYVVNQ